MKNAIKSHSKLTAGGRQWLFSAIATGLRHNDCPHGFAGGEELPLAEFLTKYISSDFKYKQAESNEKCKRRPR